MYFKINVEIRNFQRDELKERKGPNETRHTQTHTQVGILIIKYLNKTI